MLPPSNTVSCGTNSNLAISTTLCFKPLKPSWNKMEFMQQRFYHKMKIGLNIQFGDTNILQKAVDLISGIPSKYVHNKHMNILAFFKGLMKHGKVLLPAT